MYAKINEDLEKNFEISDFPLNIAIEVTNRCNLNCIMCSNSELTRPRGFMPMKLYKKIIDEVAAVNKNTRIWLDFMGEPLLAGFKLYYMIDYAKKNGCTNVFTNTNGQLMSEEYADMLLDSGINYISLDCDGFSKETYEKIRVNGDRDRFYKNVGYLLKEKYRRKSDVIIDIKIIEMDENRDEIPQIVSYWQERGAWIAVRRMSDWADYKMTGFTGNDGRIACGHLIGTCPIAWDGSVEACVWDGDCRNVVGNVNDESLAEIWKRKNEGIVRIHMEHDWDNLPQMCVGCTTWKNIGENRQDEFGNNQNRNYDVKNNLYV